MLTTIIVPGGSVRAAAHAVGRVEDDGGSIDWRWSDLAF